MPFINKDALSSLSRTTIPLNLEEPRIIVTFGILFISLFAVSFPSVSKQVSFLRIPYLVFFIGKHFGTGAILSTAFCHLVPDAFSSLQHPAVDQKYHGIGRWTGMIILASLLSIFLVEYASTSYVDHLHAEPSAPPSSTSSADPSRPPTPPAENPPPSQGSSKTLTSCVSPTITENTPLLPPSAPKRTKSLCNFDHHRDDALLSLILLNSPRGLIWGRDVVCICDLRRVALAHASDRDSSLEEDREETNKTPMVGRNRQVVGILILQLGIMIHSLVIGLTLAITSGREFAPLVTAIIFHQLFEGLSLGIRIAGLPPAPTFPSSVPSPELPLPVHSPPASYSKQNEDESDHRGWATHWLSPTLSILFAITTPLGIILGMFVFASGKSGTSAEQTARMHLTQGLMSGISAGMLIYAATVEMLAGDFVYGDVGGDHGQLHDHDHGHAAHEHVHTHGDDSTMGSGRRKVVAVGSLVAGVLTMGLVGLGE